jgi:hypothetical protein
MIISSETLGRNALYGKAVHLVDKQPLLKECGLMDSYQLEGSSLMGCYKAVNIFINSLER